MIVSRGMERVLSVMDDGQVGAGQARARDLAALRAVAAGERGALLRFYRCRPAALLGRHQWPDKELRLGYCRDQGIDVIRRPSGGGALYLDQGQLAWSLVMPSAAGPARPGLATHLEHACRAVAAGLARLGVATRFKPPNDLEVAGRKLASCHLALEEGAALLHGTVLLDVDVERMLHALRVPTEKLSAEGLEGARQRLATLDEIMETPPGLDTLRRALTDGFAEVFGLVARPSATEFVKPSTAASADEEAGWPHDEPFAESFWICGGGVLRARLGFDTARSRIVRAALGGDVTVFPSGLLERLACSLSGLAVTELRTHLAAFFAEEDAELLGFGPSDVAQVLGRALARREEERDFGLLPGRANCLMVHACESRSAKDVARRASVMLVPYCAKLPVCKWRHRDGCTECGLCEVGEAYRLARERGLRVISINNYEHLCRTLDDLKREGVEAYLGMCCSQFYQKRNRAFREAGIPAVLMDVSGSNCYELHQEEQAYAGTFEAKAELDIALLAKVMGAVEDGTD